MSARWTSEDIPDQTGRTVLVTGANSGLGLRSAEALAGKGARVLMACRNPAKAATALEQVAAVATGAAPEFVPLDLADLSSVRERAAALVDAGERIDVLMNNAGVMVPPLGRTAEGFELQFGTNHLGHFAFTGLVLPALLRADRPRVVLTSSIAHYPGRIRWDDPNWEHHRYSKWTAYSQSKLANLLFMEELGRRGGELLVSAAAHPGYAATHLQTAGAQASGNRTAERIMTLGNRIFAQTDAMGALPQLYAATMPEVRSGDYFGPDRLFGTRGHPHPAMRTSASRDAVAAARLWTLSEQLTGVTYDFSEPRSSSR